MDISADRKFIIFGTSVGEIIVQADPSSALKSFNPIAEGFDL